MIDHLIKKFASNSATIGVVGLGYVGLPLVLRFADCGFKVIGFDVDKEKLEKLNNGISYIKHIPDAQISELIASGRFSCKADFGSAGICDAIIICVPTPLTANREPDMNYITHTCDALYPHIRANQLFVLESSTYPGTTAEVVVPILEGKSALRNGKDFWVAFSPEREDPGNKYFDLGNTPKIVGSDTPEGLELATVLYNTISTVVVVSSTRVAESAKILENTFRAVNIALVNELKMAFAKMNIDIWEVIRAASTKPFGFMPFYPGPGLGGHCIPIDPFYLTWKAREYGVATRFIELAGEINSNMPDYVVRRATEILNDYGKAVNGAAVLLLGLAYKPGVDDDRESPTYHIMRSLKNLGASVQYHDPFIAEIGKVREFPEFIGMKSTSLLNLDTYDLIILVTAHSMYKAIDFSKCVLLDTRGFISGPDIRRA
jgi:UDP-N-acetyl-D-glucosamine dehydrogenase